MLKYIALAACIALTGCTSLQSASQDATQAATIAAQIEVAAGTPDLATLQKGCDAFNAEVAKPTTVVGGGAVVTAGYVAAPGQAFCKIVQGGQVPANADSNSVNWLGVLETTISTVKALAPIAAVVL